MSESPPRRAVVLVGTPAAPYSRALRIARALTDVGYSSEIAAVATAGVPDAESDGPITIRRYRPSGPFAPFAATHTGPARRGAPSRLPRPIRNARRSLEALVRWILWPITVRGWWATLARELPAADLYHACGSLAIAPALRARERDARDGRRSRTIYDAIDDVVAGNNVLGMPRAVLAAVRSRERGWARSADGRVTVNEALATSLAVRWGTPPPIVVPNWPEGTLAPDAEPTDLIRATLGLPPSTRIVVFQGRLGPNRGLTEAAEAIIAVPDAALVLIGFGGGYAASAARDDDPRFAGRHFTLPAVHPDALLEWTAAADVAIVPLPPVSANQRASTPNKFWEAIAAGTPLVLGPDLAVMEALLREHDLGVIAGSLAPADLAAAIREVIDVSPEAAAARRRRIAAIAREQFSWPVAADRYKALVARLQDRPPTPA